MHEVVIVSAVITPVGSFVGSLKDITPADLGSMSLKQPWNGLASRPNLLMK